MSIENSDNTIVSSILKLSVTTEKSVVVIRTVATNTVEVVSLYVYRLASSVRVAVLVTVPVGTRIDPNVLVVRWKAYVGYVKVTTVKLVSVAVDDLVCEVVDCTVINRVTRLVGLVTKRNPKNYGFDLVDVGYLEHVSKTMRSAELCVQPRSTR